MKPKNLTEFKALIERYETITLKEIKKEPFGKYFTAQNLTGFGNPYECTLCKAASDSCINDCVYSKPGCGCMSGENAKTYYRIADADNPLKLLNAYRARAKRMKTLLKSTS